MKKLALAAAMILFATVASSDTARVVDADTIDVSGYRWRLNGVDAPELGTRAGQDAKRWLVNWLRGKDVSCKWNGDVTHGRKVGVCYADGTDIGAAVISAGQALDCHRYSGGRYAGLETAAARSRLQRARYCR